MEDQDHDEGVQNDHEAREEHYKADDASSAVHDTQTISTEPEKVSSENLEANDLELEKNSNNNNTNDVNGDQKNSKSQLGEGVTAENDSQLNMKAGEKMDDEIINTEDQSTKNATIVPVSNGQPELSNNSMDVNTEAGNETSSSSQHNEIGVTSDSNQAQNAKIATEEASNLKTTELEQVNSNTIADSGETDSNSSVPDKTENIDNKVKPDGSDKVTKPEVKADAEVNSGSSSTTKETADTAMDGNSDAKNELGGTEENKGSSATDGTEAVFHDHIDSSDSSVGQEEARINLDTLPENSGDGINSRDVAAE
ncbi:hypothetical protein GH714_008822 [Hevea brasiliensis]|uniref:Uncharacterized protein n=1 Tax=Hevea brasiliensis TaxID=3981 RepID=A0A6A6KYZ7_HEVBR|nr:hypothetical protein GH714_008822 [Hevea brasiliensis]